MVLDLRELSREKPTYKHLSEHICKKTSRKWIGGARKKTEPSEEMGDGLCGGRRCLSPAQNDEKKPDIFKDAGEVLPAEEGRGQTS